MLRKQVYQYILKLMMDHPHFLQYLPTESGIWITDGVLAFCFEEDKQVFDLSQLTVVEGLRDILERAPVQRSDYLLRDTNCLKITGRLLAHIYEHQGVETLLDDKLLGKYFPDQDYEYFQSGQTEPVFVSPVEGPGYVGIIMPIRPTSGDDA